MPQAAIDEKTMRDKLKTKRKLLFEKFRRNPSNTHLAIEIRSIDDPITYLTHGVAIFTSRLEAGTEKIGQFLTIATKMDPLILPLSCF